MFIPGFHVARWWGIDKPLFTYLVRFERDRVAPFDIESVDVIFDSTESSGRNTYIDQPSESISKEDKFRWAFHQRCAGHHWHGV